MKKDNSLGIFTSACMLFFIFDALFFAIGYRTGIEVQKKEQQCDTLNIKNCTENTISVDVE